MELSENEKLQSFMAVHSFLQDGENFTFNGGEINCEINVHPGGDCYIRILKFHCNGNAEAGIEDDILKGYHFDRYVFNNKWFFKWNDINKVLILRNDIFTLSFKRINSTV